MGKGKNVVAGGGAARPVADQFSNYLGGFMNPQGGMPGANGALQQTLGMGQATNNLLNGRIGDPTSLQGYFNSGMGGNGMVNGMGQSNAQFNPQQIGGQFNPSQFQQAQQYSPQQVGGQFNPAQFQNTQLQGPQTGTPNGVGGVGSLGSVQTRFNANDVITNFNPQQVQGNYQGPSLQNTQQIDPMFAAQMGQFVDPSANIQGLQALQQRQMDRGVADLRARFGAQGGSAFGTGAQYAEGNYRAEADAQNQAQLAQFMQQQQGLGLQQRGQTLNTLLGAQGNNNQGILGLNQQQQQGSQFGAQLGMQGQLANQNMGLQSAQLGQQGQIANQGASLQSQQLGLQGQSANQSAILQNQQLQNDALLRSMGLSNEAIAQYNSQNLQQGLAGNQFEQQNAQFGAQFGQQGQQLNNQFGLQANQQNNDVMNQINQLMNNQNQFGANFGQNAGQLNNQFGLNAAQMQQGNQQFDINALLQNQGMGNQFNLGMQNVGANLQGQQLQAQQAALAQLMNSLGQTQQLGTPQAQMQYKPSWGSQLFNGAMQVGQLGAKLYGASQGVG